MKLKKTKKIKWVWVSMTLLIGLITTSLLSQDIEIIGIGILFMILSWVVKYKVTSEEEVILRNPKIGEQIFVLFTQELEKGYFIIYKKIDGEEIFSFRRHNNFLTKNETYILSEDKTFIRLD